MSVGIECLLTDEPGVAAEIAGMLDGIDGRIARLLNGQTRFGAELDMATAIAIFLFATLAGGLTGAPGGLGGAEIAMVALLTLKGISPEVAIAATSVTRLTTLWFAILIGLLVFPIAERISKKAKDALEIS